MKTRPLPDQETLRALLDYDPETGELRWKCRPESMFQSERHGRTWNTRFATQPAFTAVTGAGYHDGDLFGVKYLAHRIIWKIVSGVEPRDIDHVNGNRVDNRLVNLREVSRSTNSKNASLRTDNTSGIVGVHFCARRQRWNAQIKVNRRHINLGHFPSLNDAVAARKAAETKYGFHENHGKARTG